MQGLTTHRQRLGYVAEAGPETLPAFLQAFVQTLCVYAIPSILGLIYAYFNITTYEYINLMLDTRLSKLLCFRK